MKTFEIAGADIAAEEFDNEYVVLDLASGKYFSLSGITALVWRGLVDGHSIAALSEGSGDQHQAAIAKSEAAFLEHGLLRETESARSPSLPAGDLAASIAAAAPEPGFEMFEDLADLLLADPIHDVDQEAGWPHMPADRK